MRIRENDRIGRGQHTQIVATFDEPFRPLAVSRTGFRNGLVEAHQRSTAAVPEKNNFRNPGLAADELHGRLDVQWRFFPAHLAFIVLKSGVEAKGKKAAAG